MVKTIDPNAPYTITWSALCDLFFNTEKPEFDKEFQNDEHTDESLMAVAVTEAEAFLDSTCMEVDREDAKVLAANFINRL